MKMKCLLLSTLLTGALSIMPMAVTAQTDDQQQEAAELVDSAQEGQNIEAFSDTTAVEAEGEEVQYVANEDDDSNLLNLSFNSTNSWEGWLLAAFILIITLFFVSLPLIALILMAWLLIRLLNRNRRMRRQNSETTYYNENEMENKRKLYRSDDRVLGGVCGGLAEYFDFDPTVVRVAFALLTFFTAFSGIPCYLILWLIMPEKSFRM